MHFTAAALLTFCVSIGFASPAKRDVSPGECYGDCIMGGFGSSADCQKDCNFYPTKRDISPGECYGDCIMGGFASSGDCQKDCNFYPTAKN
ncbi:hypothetical protein N7509_003168 [Penicillium cosmopolitanum]|uniref:Uncharacterized protein n=1 Tax=Penicillium cosmopolitanum TaxID=1131564 RepID=A0A9W9W4P2_9EURO|nr:uncharacterized protein N7509_003168 [Penicillium cosmopolitanum]KAJ5403297.1 hypothetical protein N7509_003168 [Penicillium cosmopolitanum]